MPIRRFVRRISYYRGRLYERTRNTFFFVARPKKHQKSVSRPILARPLLHKTGLWPVLISDPPVDGIPCNSYHRYRNQNFDLLAY